jgi:pyrroloquinoline quinone biosynthesis protein E
VDRFVFAPFALVWLMVTGAGMYASGLVNRSIAAEHDTPWRPQRVLLIRLMPTTTFVRLLERLRGRFPDIRLTALLASDEGRAEVSQAADEVFSPSDGGIFGIVRRLRSSRFDSVMLAGGADYGPGLSYAKAAVLARMAPGAARYQWEVGEALPGTPLRRAVWRAVTAPGTDAVAASGLLKRAVLRRRYAREPARGPGIVQIGITKACNYHCLFCPFHNPQVDAQHREADQPRMSYEMFARLLGELKQMGTRAIDICGDGEPLTHPESLVMIALARELGFEVTLATNAALLTEDRARSLVELGVRRMHISFNAATDDVYERLHPGAPAGARARIIERLRAMAEYAEAEGLRPVDVEFSAVLNRLNMHQIPQMVDAAHEARAGWFMLILMGPAEGAEELLPRTGDWVLIRSDIDRAAARAREYGIRTNLDAIRPGASAAGTGSVYERIPCYIGHEYALITADGSVMFCCQCSTPLGDLRRDSFRQIWYSHAYRQAREQARRLPKGKGKRQKAKGNDFGLALSGCECFTACSHVVVNLDVYRKLYGERAARSVL